MPEGKLDMQDVPYRSIVGSLMYLMVCTRPDLGACLSVLSRYLQNPGREHWESAKRALRYVKGTMGLGILYRRCPVEAPVGFCDASYGGVPHMRRSTTGYCFVLAMGAVTWSSKVQNRTAKSSCEAEYVALAQAGSEASWLHGFLWELGIPIEDPIGIASDSQSALKLASNPIYHELSKHIQIRYHFIRDLVEFREVELFYLPAEFQPADALTKCVDSRMLLYSRAKIGVLELAQEVPDAGEP